eukprot:scaffold14617_cov37-Prasinocladus_malaysianus.AAC.3
MITRTRTRTGFGLTVHRTPWRSSAARSRIHTRKKRPGVVGFGCHGPWAHGSITGPYSYCLSAGILRTLSLLSREAAPPLQVAATRRHWQGTGVALECGGE